MATAICICVRENKAPVRTHPSKGAHAQKRTENKQQYYEYNVNIIGAVSRILTKYKLAFKTHNHFGAMTIMLYDKYQGYLSPPTAHAQARGVWADDCT